MSGRRYLDDLIARFEALRANQLEPIQRAAQYCARVIAGGGLVHLFGTGHGSIPALEAFPRTGSFVGWHPIVEPGFSPHLRVGGEGGVHQFRFLQAAEGFGRALLEAQPIHPGDAFVICSHSGVNAVIVEVALLVQQRGLPALHALSAETAALLVAQGRPPLVLGHIDREGKAVPAELRSEYISAYLTRLWKR